MGSPILCATCLVKAECLHAAIVGNERGVWGGTTATDRENARRVSRRR
ncbi:MAG: WhiB family transcriptional regulator [Actinomycetota bacterium]